MLEKTRLEMSNEKRLPLKTILKNLEDIANEVRTDPSSCENIKQELKGCGYDCEELNEQVIKVLAVAVNEAIQKKVGLGYGKKVVSPKLHQLLDNGKHESLDDYFIPVEDPSEFELLRSPLDLAKYLQKPSKIGRQWLVKNIIQHQFDIRWKTPDGDPDDYTFYQFCNNENTTDLLKYIPRQAHVKATLYKECRRRNVNDLRGITKENLCPTVYIRTAGRWKSWRADEDEFNDVEDINTHLSWIDSSILTFITENADEQNNDDESVQDSLEKPTLYWAVLDDSDFKPGGKLKLKEIGRTQVYVGKTNKGIKGRWTGSGNNHCYRMKKCLDNVCDMMTVMTYDPLTLKRISLVQARLALAKVRGEKTALFVIKTFGDEAPEESSSETSEDEESDATDPLTEAEKWHREGKRVDNEHNNIIQFSDESEWKPKDMRYGMNKY